MQFLTQTRAAQEIDRENPPSRETMQRWHDHVGGPRDSAGKRVWTPDICEKVRRARAEAGRAKTA